MPRANDIAATIAQYRARGYGTLRGVFDAAEIAEMASAFDRHWARGIALGASFRHGNLHYRIGKDECLGKIVRMVQWPSYEDSLLARIRTDARLFALLQPLLGDDIKQIINQLHWKRPGAAGEFAFHQDVRFRRPREAYRNLAQSFVQTGIAIDRHDAASGAMRIYPASHNLGEVDLAISGRVMDGTMADASLHRAGLDPAKLIDLDLAPGDVALWNPFTIHGSGSNVSTHDRRFYLNGYVRAADCARGEFAFRGGAPCPLGDPVLVHYEELHERPEPHFIDP
ncbi:MAG TPA: phytanoyl-CoA dioxygenase family protein [Stellaceae bacterium]|jgi:ectoine hydroxylase-related dioxygenase (phytanoyl-CoA dioxygenase family)|nr:phytanoyl-CoA dioxygenase family protein [Stellaceae bacterium]